MMRTTIYATFEDPKQAEKAAGALLDHRTAPTDLSIVQSHLWGGLCWDMGGKTIRGLTSLFIPGVGLVLGSGTLASRMSDAARLDSECAVSSAMTGYLKDQGFDSHDVAQYEHAVQHGGAILCVTLPSGDVDECFVWAVLSKYVGLNVSCYANRPYVI